MLLPASLGRFQSSIAVIIAAVALGLFLDWQQTNQFRAEQRLAVLESIDDYRSALEQVIHEKILVTEGLAATVAARPEIAQQEFERAARSMVRHVDGVLNVAAAPDLVIEMVHPYRPNQQAVGLDFRERPDLLEAVEQAINTRETMFDGPIDLVQGGRGFVTRAAVFEFYAGAFRSDFWGVVSIVFDADSVFASAGLSTNETEFAFVVQDQNGEPITGSIAVLGQSPVTTEIRAPGILWQLSIIPRDGWVLVPPNRLQTWLILMGIAMMIVALMRAFRWSLELKNAAEARLSEAVDALDDAFSLYDSQNRFVMCNERYKELYPSAADLMVPGAHFGDILRRGVETGQYPLADGREEEWIAERLEAQSDPGEAKETQLANGRWLRIKERRTASGNVAGFRVDITELKTALAKSEKANEAKTEFLNTVSHELRTPLTVVLGYSSFLENLETLPSHRRVIESLEDGDVDSASANLEAFETELKRFSRQIALSGKQLMGLISDILDMAAIEQGTVELKLEAVDLNSTIGEIAGGFRGEAEAKGIDLRVESEGLMVSADRRRLHQILHILIGNAVKFTEKGAVIVRSKVQAGRASIEVIDTGMGIPAAKLEQIFEHFGQADGSSARRHGGLGLGLPIAKQLAELQGGSITARSVDGQGSVFTLELDKPNSARGEAA